MEENGETINGDETEKKPGPKLLTLKDLQEYAKEKYGIADIVRELGPEITPADFIDKYDLIETEVRKFNHWGEVEWNRVMEARKAYLAELEKMYKYAPDIFAALKDYEEQMHQHWIDYSCLLEVASMLVWRRGAVFFNTYMDEHQVKRGLEKAEILAMEKTAAILISVAEQRGMSRELLNKIVQKEVDKIDIDRKVALEKENTRVKNIQISNIMYIRANKNARGEVKWNDLREGVGSHFTRDEWKVATEKQKDILIRTEKKGSKPFRFVSENKRVTDKSTDERTDEASD